MCMEHTLIIIYPHISHVKEANYCNNILEFYHSWYSLILHYWFTNCIDLNIFPTQLLTPLIRIYIYFRDEKIIEQGPIDSYTLVGRNLSCFEMYFCFSDYSPTILRTKPLFLFFFPDLFIISLTLENCKGKLDLGPSFKFTYATQPPRFVLFLYNMYILPVYLQSELLIKAWNVRVMQLSFLTKTYMKDIVIHNGQSGVL